MLSPNLELFHLSVLHTRVVLHQVAILIQRPPAAPIDPSNPTANNTTATTNTTTLQAASDSNTTRRWTLLLHCADTTKAYLSHFCSLPTTLHATCTILNRCQLAHSAILLIKLAFSTSDATPSNPLPLRQYCNMAPYMHTFLDPCRDHDPAFCESRGGKEVCKEKDRIAHFREKVTRLKMWYERLQSFEGVGAEDGLGDLSTLNLERIERQEEMMFDMDWSGIDFAEVQIILG